MIMRPPLYYYEPLYTYEDYCEELRRAEERLTAEEREDLRRRVEAIEAAREAERQASLNSDLPF